MRDGARWCGSVVPRSRSIWFSNPDSTLGLPCHFRLAPPVPEGPPRPAAPPAPRDAGLAAPAALADGVLPTRWACGKPGQGSARVTRTASARAERCWRPRGGPYAGEVEPRPKTTEAMTMSLPVSARAACAERAAGCADGSAAALPAGRPWLRSPLCGRSPQRWRHWFHVRSAGRCLSPDTSDANFGWWRNRSANAVCRPRRRHRCRSAHRTWYSANANGWSPSCRGCRWWRCGPVRRTGG